MIEGLYAFLDSIGFSHPLHPAVVHIPMGMVIGMVFFSLTGIIWKKQQLENTAHHCSILGLVFIFPTLITGFLDWQARLGGEWEFLIILKIILGLLLTILLFIAIFFKQQGAEPKKMLIIYLLCLACAGGLGFSGGELVYG